MSIPDRFKRLAKNVALAALAAFVSTAVGLVSAAEFELSKAAVVSAVVAAGYAAIRAAVGVVKAELGDPFDVDTPPASGPELEA